MTTDSHLQPFKQFAKVSSKGKHIQNRNLNTVVVYTRVSSAEQTSNMSLPYQRELIDKYVKNNGLIVAGYFGGTFESAKTDGRKEFQRMLKFVKDGKGKISQILVSSTDRFSRTGGEAIKIAKDLRDKFGVVINAISQPTDVYNPTGEFQQNIQLLFSQYDNDLRRQKCVAGMEYQVQRGNWIHRPPLGYSSLKINGERKIVINETGKLLKKAFEWRLAGDTLDRIIEKLKAFGITIYHQHLSRILSNPFYAGIISHSLLHGSVVDGQHEPLITKEQFLRINDAKDYRSVPHSKENEKLPLKVFMKCDLCGKPYTGYEVKKKKLFYYKCKLKGCRCNKNVPTVHETFVKYLSTFSIRPELVKPLQYHLEHVFEDLNKEKREQQQLLSKQLSEVTKKIETIEEKFYALDTMDEETFKKLHDRYKIEKASINNMLEECKRDSSNQKEVIKKSLKICANISKIWQSGNLNVKEKLQRLVFPNGIYYNQRKNSVRTERVNSIIKLNVELTKEVNGKKNCESVSYDTSAILVGVAGFEPTTSCTPSKCATGLRYTPNGVSLNG